MRASLILTLCAVMTLVSCARNVNETYQGYVEGEFVHVGAGIGGRLGRLLVSRGQTVQPQTVLFELHLGQPPAAAQLPAFRLSDLRLPTELPVTLPSNLARQRPDILAAEALVRVANARVGISEANRYPNITLSGTGGAVAVSSLISGAGFALLGASVAQPLFRGGQLKAEQRASIAAFDQAHAAYREAILTGLQNVADVLVALDGAAKTLRARKETADFASTAYEITSRQYQAGGVSLLSLLDAERKHLSASLDEITAIAYRYSHTAALFQALGGGWWTAPGATAVPKSTK